MNWIKANKFLSVFFAVMLVGIGVLGYLLFSARSHYVEVRGRYEDQARELNRLQSLQPFPAPANVQAMEVQRKEHQEAILGLRKTLAANQIPLEPMSEVQFQDKLRESVSRVRTKAAEKGVVIESPEKFYMGFALYETQPPRPEAAPLLGRQLKAIEVVVMQLIENKVASFNLDRPPLPEENEKRSTRANEEAGPGGEGRRGGEKGTAPLVTHQPFDIVITTEQGSFQTVLNDIVKDKTQFYIPRALEVNNAVPKSPPKDVAAVGAPPTEPPPVPPPTAPPIDNKPPAPPAAPGEALKLVFGTEKVQSAMRIEIVDFADVPPPTGK